MDKISDKRLKEISESGTNCFKHSIPSEGDVMARELLQMRELRRQLVELGHCVDPETGEDTTLERVKYLCRTMVTS